MNVGILEQVVVVMCDSESVQCSNPKQTCSRSERQKDTTYRLNTRSHNDLY